MGEPIETHFDKQVTPQGRHARKVPRSGRHARVAPGEASAEHRPHGDAAEAALFAVPVEMLGEQDAAGEQEDASAERGRAAASRAEGRHAREAVSRPSRSRGEGRHSAGASAVAHNGAFISGGGAVIGGSSWSVRGRSLMAAVVVAAAALVLVGVLLTHGRAGANVDGGGDQGAAQETLEIPNAGDGVRRRRLGRGGATGAAVS